MTIDPETISVGLEKYCLYFSITPSFYGFKVTGVKCLVQGKKKLCLVDGVSP